MENTVHNWAASDVHVKLKLASTGKCLFVHPTDRGAALMSLKRIAQNSVPPPSILDDIVRRVVHAAQPDKIVLFGSAARGEMGPHSDVDLLVIKGGKFNRRRLVAKIYDELYGAGAAVDVVIVTPDEVQRYRDAPCLAIFPALRDGRIVYGT